MKISPITFTSSLEPKLKEFWENKSMLENAQVVIERSHNFTLERTGLSVWSKAPQGQNELHCFLELTSVPQQDEKAAMNCLVRMATGQNTQFLMVLKDESEYEQWGAKLIKTIEDLNELGQLQPQDNNNQDAVNEDIKQDDEVPADTADEDSIEEKPPEEAE